MLGGKIALGTRQGKIDYLLLLEEEDVERAATGTGHSMKRPFAYPFSGIYYNIIINIM